jgi:hypothetical protein
MAGGWDIRRIYLYLVSFATLMMMIISTVQVFQGIFNIVYPNPEPGPYISDIRMRYQEAIKTNSKITEAEIKSQVETERAQNLKNDRYYRVKSVIDNIIFFGVALPVYLYHWKKIQGSES